MIRIAVSPPYRIGLVGFAALVLAACSTALPSVPALSRDNAEAPELGPNEAPTYADLVEFSRAADLVAIVTVDDQRTFPPERAPDVGPGRARLYVEALTQNLLVAPRGVGEELTFVVDQPRDSDGDPPDLEDRSFIIFGDIVPGSPGSVQLITSSAMLPAGADIEARTRRVLTQLAAANLPPEIRGVRDVISVPGNLAGESETQMFVETVDRAPVSLSVVRRPGMRPEWGISLGEIVDASARPPAPESLAWYRFACFLPRDLPEDSFLQADRASRAQARTDYAFILAELGPCERRFTRR